MGHEQKLKFNALKYYKASILKELFFDGLLFLTVASLFFLITTLENYYLLAGSSILLGLLSIQVVLVFHDCMHESLTKNKMFNVTIARIIGTFYMCPFHFIKSSHMSHHRHASDHELDTEMLHLSEELAQKRTWGKLLNKIGQSIFAPILFAPILHLSHFLDWIKGEKKMHKDLMKNTVIDIALILIFWSILGLELVSKGILAKTLIFGVFIPFIIGLSLVYIAASPLHSMMYVGDTKNMNPVCKQILIRRTFDSKRGFFSIFLSNFNYHLEHHLYPNVNRWELKKLALALRPELINFAKDQQLPLMIHADFNSWYKTYLKHRTEVNSCTTVESWKKINRVF